MPLTASTLIQSINLLLKEHRLWQPDALEAHLAYLEPYLDRFSNWPIFSADDTAADKTVYREARRNYMLAAIHWQHSLLTYFNSDDACPEGSFLDNSLLTQLNRAISTLSRDEAKSCVIACDIANFIDISDEEIRNILRFGEHVEIILVSKKSDLASLADEIRTNLAKLPDHWPVIFTGDYFNFADALDFIQQSLVRQRKPKPFYLSSTNFRELEVSSEVYSIKHVRDAAETDLPPAEEFDSTTKEYLIAASMFETAQLAQIKTVLLSGTDEYISGEPFAEELLELLRSLFAEIELILMLFNSTESSNIIKTITKKFLDAIVDITSISHRIRPGYLLENFPRIIEEQLRRFLTSLPDEERNDLAFSLNQQLFAAINTIITTDRERQMLADDFTIARISDLLAEPFIVNHDDKTVTFTDNSLVVLALCRNFYQHLFKDFTAAQAAEAIMGCVTAIMRNPIILTRYLVGETNYATGEISSIPPEIALDFQNKVHTELTGITLANGETVDIMPYITKQQLDCLVEKLVSLLGDSTTAKLLFLDCDDTMMLGDGTPNVEDYEAWAAYLAELHAGDVIPILMTTRTKLYGEGDDGIQQLLNHPALTELFAGKIFLSSVTRKALAIQYVWQELSKRIPGLSGKLGLFDDQPAEIEYADHVAEKGIPLEGQLVTQHRTGSRSLRSMHWAQDMNLHLGVSLARAAASAGDEFGDSLPPPPEHIDVSERKSAIEEIYVDPATEDWLDELARESLLPPDKHTDVSKAVRKRKSAIEEIYVDPKTEDWLDELAKESHPPKASTTAMLAAMAAAGTADRVDHEEAAAGPGDAALIEILAAEHAAAAAKGTDKREASIQKRNASEITLTSLGAASAASCGGDGLEEIALSLTCRSLAHQ